MELATRDRERKDRCRERRKEREKVRQTGEEEKRRRREAIQLWMPSAFSWSYTESVVWVTTVLP
jgi:hypothetical protein